MIVSCCHFPTYRTPTPVKPAAKVPAKPATKAATKHVTTPKKAGPKHPEGKKVVDFTFQGQVILEGSAPVQIGLPNIWTGNGVMHGVANPLTPTPTMVVSRAQANNNNNYTDVSIVKRRPGGGRRLESEVVLEPLGMPAGFKGRALKARQEAQELGMGGNAWTARVDSPTLAQPAGQDFDGCCVNCESTADLCNPAN